MKNLFNLFKKKEAVSTFLQLRGDDAILETELQKLAHPFLLLEKEKFILVKENIKKFNQTIFPYSVEFHENEYVSWKISKCIKIFLDNTFVEFSIARTHTTIGVSIMEEQNTLPLAYEHMENLEVYQHVVTFLNSIKAILEQFLTYILKQPDIPEEIKNDISQALNTNVNFQYLSKKHNEHEVKCIQNLMSKSLKTIHYQHTLEQALIPKDGKESKTIKI